jgi:hypothetical protein
VNDTAVAKEILLIHDIFGTDLDQSTILKTDNKAAYKCQDTKLKVYNKCKKDGLKGKTPPDLIISRGSRDQVPHAGRRPGHPSIRSRQQDPESLRNEARRQDQQQVRGRHPG